MMFIPPLSPCNTPRDCEHDTRDGSFHSQLMLIVTIRFIIAGGVTCFEKLI